MARVPIWDPRILWATVAMVGSLLVGALILAVVGRWRRRQGLDRPSPADDLARYRVLYERGDIDDDEYKRIRTLFKTRLVRDLTGHDPQPKETPAPTDSGPPAPDNSTS